MPPPFPTIVVSIINFRTGDLTLKCLRSVIADLEEVDARVVVVDNNSGDGSAEQIERWIATQDAAVPVSLVRSTYNSGFSGGHNQGIRAHAADFYLIINSDTVVRPGFFAALLSTAHDNPDAGLLSPCIEYDNGLKQTSCFRFPSPASELIRGANSGPVTRFLSRFDVPLSTPLPIEQIEWVSFACILLRGSMVSEIGLMDEGYFLYFEDTEYCLRALKAGWNIKYVPAARVVHFRGGSGPVKALQNAKGRLPTYYYASRTRFFRQAYGWRGLVAANVLWLLGRGLANSRRLFGKSVPQANQGEMRDIWINIFSPLNHWHTPTEK